MRKRKLFSKEKIQQIVKQHKQTISEIEVECGKEQKPQTVGVSEWFASRLNGYVNKYLGSASPESWLFRSERGGPNKYSSIYSKVKKIGIKSGILLYCKDGWLKSRFPSHKMRHTF
jgi:integrase